MESSFDKVQSILKQAERIAKEFSDHIDSVYLIGSASVAPETARDVDLVVFVKDAGPLKKIISVKFFELSQIFGFKVDPICVQTEFLSEPKSLFDPLFRSQISLTHHGQLLWGRAQPVFKIDDTLLWAYRWWCLYGDLFHLENPENSQVVQAQAKIVSGEWPIQLGWSKQAMLQAFEAESSFKSIAEILELLLVTYDKFERVSPQNHGVDLYASPWMKGLSDYCDWLKVNVDNKLGQPFLRLGLNYRYFQAYIVRKNVR